jgi:hypothetical protein
MSKITDNDYFLPEILALYKTRDLNTGSTEPIIIRGICKKTHIKSDYVVKFKNGPRMSNQSLCNELVASFIGMELGLNVAESAIVEINEDFVETLKGKKGHSNALKSIGLNFGCKYVEGVSTFLNNQNLTPGQYSNAQHIFSFDIFISNVDRRIDKPNMLTDGENILIIDHELAFSFIYEIFQNPTPWLIRPDDMTWISNHFFYSKLRGNEHNFDIFVDKLTTLDDVFWDKLFHFVPDDWISDHIIKIKNNLSLLVENRIEFKEELKRILS